MSSYHQFTINERELIFLYHELSFSIRRIAKLIKRSPSTISRELQRNTTTTLGYRPSIAQKQYHKNKARCGRNYRLADHKIKTLVSHLFLDLQWSPEEISNRLIYENCTMRLSYNTIYRAIYRGFLMIVDYPMAAVAQLENYVIAVKLAIQKNTVNVVVKYRYPTRSMNDH